MSLIRNFQEEQAARLLRTRDTLRQWHHRRTSQRSAPSVDDFQVQPVPFTYARTHAHTHTHTHTHTRSAHMLSQLSLNKISL